jgi:hypothetical protein
MSAPSPSVVVSLQSTAIMFTLEDMRLFHHFILEAYPHLPVGNEKVWVRDVPAFAHHVSPFTSTLTHSTIS